MDFRKRYFSHVLTTDIGPLTLIADGEALVAVRFENEEGSPRSSEPAERGGCPLLTEAARQIGEYLRGERRDFDVPIRLEGTDFQLLVWNTLRTIPYGETRTYAEIAARIDRPKAVRAVGGANHRNPLPLLVPCHRVVGADGTLVGFGGGLEVKRRLLEIEGCNVRGAPVNPGAICTPSSLFSPPA